MPNYYPAYKQYLPDTVYRQHHMTDAEVLAEGAFASRTGKCGGLPSCSRGQAMYWVDRYGSYFATTTCGEPGCRPRDPSKANVGMPRDAAGNHLFPEEAVAEIRTL